MDLDRAIDDVVQHLRAIHLDQADLDARFVALFDLLRGVQRQQPARLDFRRRIENELLNLLVLTEVLDAKSQVTAAQDED